MINIHLLYLGSSQISMNSLSHYFPKMDFVTSESEALMALSAGSFDALCIDESIETQLSLDLFTKVRVVNKSIVSILVATNPSSQTLIRALQLGLDGLLLTPIENSASELMLAKLSRSVLLNQQMRKQNLLLNQYKNALDASLFISKTNKYGVITYINDRFCELSGYEPNEIIGKTHHLFKHPDRPAEQIADLWDTISSKKVWHGTLINQSKKGIPFYTDTFIIPFLNEQYEIHEYMDMRIDVTEIYEQKNNIQQILDGQISLVAVFEEDKIVMCNQKVLDFFNATSLELFLSQNTCICDQVVAAPDCVPSALFKKWLTNKNQLFTVQIALPSANGEISVFQATKTHLPTTEQTILSLVDITDMNHYRHTLQEKFNLATQKIQDQQSTLISQSRSAALGEMFDNIAHQWRQPIGAINNAIINAEFALELGGMSEELVAETFKNISTYTHFLSSTIDDFRNFSNPDKEKTHFIVHTIIRQTLGILQGSLDDNGIVVTYMPTPPEQELILFGAQGELSQVILNLLGNARDVLRDKKNGQAHISIALHTNGQEIIIEVADNGGGIPPDVLPKIFDPYFSTKNKAQGTGIGLYMSKTIIEKHYKGILEAKNSDEGAIFTIKIPMMANLL